MFGKIYIWSNNFLKIIFREIKECQALDHVFNFVNICYFSHDSADCVKKSCPAYTTFFIDLTAFILDNRIFSEPL